MRTHSLVVPVLCVVICLASLNQATHAYTYNITDLGTLGGTTTYGFDVNDAGQVAGYSRNASNINFGYRWDSGTMTSVGDLGGSTGSLAYGISSNGYVAGYSQNSSNLPHIYMWDGSTIIDCGVLAGGDRSFGFGVNSSGVVVGQSTYDLTGNTVVVSWTSAGGMVNLGTLGGTTGSGLHINDAGLIVGSSTTALGDTHAFLYNGSMLDLGTLGGTSSSAQRINNLGNITGYSTDASGDTHAFLYTGGTMNDLGSFAGSTNLIGLGINDSDQIVGSYNISGNNYALFWSSSTGFIDLNNEIDPASGWTLSFASAVNNNQQIVGWGTIGGVQHGFLLTLAPEPSTWASFAVGTALLLFTLHRRKLVGRAKHD